jgi:hypothetical protein
LLTFVFVSAGYLVYKEFSRRPSRKANTTVETKTPEASAKPETILVKNDTIRNKPAPKIEQAKAEPNPKTPDAQTPPVMKSKVVAYYFHTTYRCPTCLKIEQFSKEAIEQYFSQELQDGRLTFKSVNIDEEENSHYIKDYQLFTKSLVLVSYAGDKQKAWKNLTQVWVYVGEREKFFQYVKDETAKFLSEAN